MTPTESLLAHIEERSAADPHGPLIVEADGDTYSYGDAAALVHGWIEWFSQERGVRPLRVGAILPNIAVIIEDLQPDRPATASHKHRSHDRRSAQLTDRRTSFKPQRPPRNP